MTRPVGDRDYPEERDELERLRRESAAARIQYLSVSSEFDSVAKEINSRTSRNAITPREREVRALIASGKSSKQVGELLGIAFKTVVCHRCRLQIKLNAHNTADLTRSAIRMGLVKI